MEIGSCFGDIAQNRDSEFEQVVTPQKPAAILEGEWALLEIDVGRKEQPCIFTQI